MLLSARTAAWCSLPWALAALNKQRWSSLQHRSMATRQGSGNSSRVDAGFARAICEAAGTFCIFVVKLFEQWT
jgi:hypothetical protein